MICVQEWLDGRNVPARCRLARRRSGPAVEDTLGRMALPGVGDREHPRPAVVVGRGRTRRCARASLLSVMIETTTLLMRQARVSPRPVDSDNDHP